MRRSCMSWLCVVALACSPESAGDEASTSSSEAEATGASDTTGTSTATETSDTTSTTDTTETGLPSEPPVVLFPRTRILDAELAVLVNDDDPQSVAVAEAYMSARALPPENLIHLAFPTDLDVLGQAEFAQAYAAMEAELPEGIQALALTWTRPYAVDCMSITTAFSQGFDLGHCGGCAVTLASPYFDSSSSRPFDDHGLRPTMMLAGASVENVQALIDRGLQADGSVHPTGDGYMIRTTDMARSVRYGDWVNLPTQWDHEGGFTLNYIDNADGSGADAIANTDNVMFYFTGLVSVPDIATNTYLPGAIADHLTSFGGMVPTSSQMSAVAWLEAGATASFGTVVEPCNHVQKFPRASVAIDHYFRGETLVEAYTKSVEWPGQGLFVGDPLARPFDGSTFTWDSATGLLTITTNFFQPGVTYLIESAPSADGPWTTLGEGSVAYSLTLDLEIADAWEPYYRIEPAP